MRCQTKGATDRVAPSHQPMVGSQPFAKLFVQPTTGKHDLSSSTCNQRSIKLANQIPSHQPMLTLWRTDNLSDSVCNQTRTHNNNISGSLCKQRSLKLAKQARQSARQRLHFILRRQKSKLQLLQFLRCFFCNSSFWATILLKQGSTSEGRDLALKTPYSLLPYIF